MKLAGFLKSPQFWVYFLSATAAAGVALSGMGAALNNPSLIHEGIGLVVPLLIGGALIVLIVCPILIVMNRKSRK